ncbi:DUF2313 domain-containing protein [Aeromonas hydrophila]|uniref:putative phage tail protein n=1 Tax=Aeromonas hydrophila TaxID=644 RepID=UPI0016557787|nr:putative phage tail protein [Aeromonas hydrophila]MBC8686550.1 DUF2313 domain-containing protein [Aeromonas hydrophila]
MAHALEQWHEVLLQQMPRGRAWPRDPESNTSKYVLGFAKRLVDCEVSADQLYLEMRPETTVQLLPDWEEYLGLPECAVPNQTFVVVKKNWPRSYALTRTIVRIHSVSDHHCRSAV